MKNSTKNILFFSVFASIAHLAQGSFALYQQQQGQREARLQEENKALKTDLGQLRGEKDALQAEVSEKKISLRKALEEQERLQQALKAKEERINGLFYQMLEQEKTIVQLKQELSEFKKQKEKEEAEKAAEAKRTAPQAGLKAREQLSTLLKTGKVSQVVALKALLTSNNDTFDLLSKTDKLSDPVFVQELMNQKLNTKLADTPYVHNTYEKHLETFYHIPTITDEKRRNIADFQPLYQELYDILCNNAPIDAQAAPKIEKLYRFIYYF